jgi:predicted transcriptional regulator
MTLTVRLPGDLETTLDRYCAATGKTKSWVVNESLAAYLVGQAPAPHALWQQFRPAAGSRRGDLAERHSAILKDKLRAKHPRQQ